MWTLSFSRLSRCYLRRELAGIYANKREKSITSNNSLEYITFNIIWTNLGKSGPHEH